MLPKKHAIIGIPISIGFAFCSKSLIFGLIVLTMQLAIDADHWIYYIKKQHDLNLWRCYNYCLTHYAGNNTLNCPPLIFHNIYFLILLLICTYAYPLFFPIFIGSLIHVICDFFADRFLPTKNRHKWFLFR